MKTKLLTMDSWATTSATQDGIALLKTIRDISHKKDGGTDATTILDLVRMDKDMFLVHQAPTELLSSSLSKFKGAVDVVDSSDGFPWSHPAATKIVFDESNDPADLTLAKASNSSKYQTAATEAKQRYLAALFFHGLSNEAHRDLKKKIHNDALTGTDTVPRTYDKVLQLADQYNPPTSNAILAVKGGEVSPLHRKARLPLRRHRRRQRRRLRMLQLNANHTQSWGEKTAKEKCSPTVQERRTASTVFPTTTRLSTTPI